MDQIIFIMILNVLLKDSHAILNFNYTFKVLEEFNVKHPIILHTRNHFHTKLIRDLFKQGQYSGNVGKIQDKLEFSM